MAMTSTTTIMSPAPGKVSQSHASRTRRLERRAAVADGWLQASEASSTAVTSGSTPGSTARTPAGDGARKRFAGSKPGTGSQRFIRSSLLLTQRNLLGSGRQGGIDDTDNLAPPSLPTKLVSPSCPVPAPSSPIYNIDTSIKGLPAPSLTPSISSTAPSQYPEQRRPQHYQRGRTGIAERHNDQQETRISAHGAAQAEAKTDRTLNQGREVNEAKKQLIEPARPSESPSSTMFGFLTRYHGKRRAADSPPTSTSSTTTASDPHARTALTVIDAARGASDRADRVSLPDIK